MTDPLAPEVLAPAWAALVAAALVPRRPRRHLPLPSTRPAAPPAGPLPALGAAVRRAAGRPPDPTADRAAGWALVAVAVLLLTAPALVPLPVVAALLGPRLAARRRARREAEVWADALPDAVDLFALALGSGLTVATALPVVAGRAPAPLGPALVAASDRVAHGEPLVDALSRVAARSEVVRPLVAVLVAAHCDGTPAADALARLADEARASRRRAVEARARQVPVRMLFPLVGCTLPAFVLLTVVPPVVAALGRLQA